MDQTFMKRVVRAHTQTNDENLSNTVVLNQDVLSFECAVLRDKVITSDLETYAIRYGLLNFATPNGLLKNYHSKPTTNFGKTL